MRPARACVVRVFCVPMVVSYPSVLTSSSHGVRPSHSRVANGCGTDRVETRRRRRRRVFVRRPTTTDRPTPTDHEARGVDPRPMGIRAGGDTTAKDEHAWANAIAHYADRAMRCDAMRCDAMRCDAMRHLAGKGAMVDRWRSSMSIDHRCRSIDHRHR